METFTLFVDTIFGGAWRMMQTPVPLPGISITFADIWLAVAFGGIALSLLLQLVGAKETGSRGGNTRNPRISKERRNDTK